MGIPTRSFKVPRLLVPNVTGALKSSERELWELELLPSMDLSKSGTFQLPSPWV
jgi:hypothetical protein